MNHKIILVIMCVSVTLNALFAALFVTAMSRKTASFSFSGAGAGVLTGACIVSVPKGGKSVVFGPVDFTLNVGENAALQFSAFLDGKQVNMAAEPLYDPNIISVEPAPYGLFITALAPGDTRLQTITKDGINDIARVTVVRPELDYPPNKNELRKP
jgi:hypothetical protein